MSASSATGSSQTIPAPRWPPLTARSRLAMVISDLLFTEMRAWPIISPHRSTARLFQIGKMTGKGDRHKPPISANAGFGADTLGHGEHFRNRRDNSPLMTASWARHRPHASARESATHPIRNPGRPRPHHVLQSLFALMLVQNQFDLSRER